MIEAGTIIEIDSDESYEVLVSASNGTVWMEAGETSIVEWWDGLTKHRIVFFEFASAEACFLNHAEA